MLLRKILFTIISVILLVNLSSAQTDPRLPKVIPPAPNAASIQRYGDLPVSPYSGTPNISIPLYEIKSGDISIPISISYNASGIKVADESGRVGLGWVLNAGGAISRNIIGRDDWEDYLLQTFGDIPLGQKADQGVAFNFWQNCLSGLNGFQIPQAPLNDANEDFQPDLYSFNFPGHSGKFVMKRNKAVVLQRIEKIDIRTLNNKDSIWQIKTPDGFTYLFQDIETYNDQTVLRKSSWYLSQIISPTGRSIQFLYTPISYAIQQTGSYFESRPIGILSDLYCGPGSLPPASLGQVPEKTYYSLYLSKISFDQGEVQFKYSATRTDVKNDVELDSIQIYQKNFGQSANTLIKSWSFVYSYFNGTSINNWNYVGLADPYKRLKLVSLQELGSSLSLPPYHFSYYNDADLPANLPAKASFARDHWGYFNGNVGNTSLIPSFTGGGGGTINIGYMGPERDANAAKCTLFTLNNIQYPTGGSTTFEYEPNDFDVFNSMKNDHSFWSTYGESVPTYVQNSFSNISQGGNFSTTIDLSNMYPTAQYDSISASFVKLSGGFPPGSSGAISLITYTLKDSTGNVIASGQPAAYIGNTGYPRTDYLGTSSSNSGIRMTLLEPLSAGKYTWTFYTDAQDSLYASDVTVYYNKSQTYGPIFNSGDSVQGALIGGGIRIKRITDYTAANVPAKVRRYKYHHFGTDGKIYSYGRRMAKPNYSYYEPQPGNNCTLYCLMRESDSNIPLNGSTNGVSVGYDHVEELFGENGEAGKNIFTYRNEPDIMLGYQVSTYNGVIPLKPPYGGVIEDQDNGSQLTKTAYASVNGQFIKKSADSSVYTDFSNYNADIFEGIEKRIFNLETVPGQVCGIESFYIYPALTVSRFLPLFKRSTLYDMTDTTKSFYSDQILTYDSSSHLQLTSQSTYRSNGDKTTTKYTYPADYSDAQSDSANLLMKNAAYMHALPVTKQEVLLKGSNLYLLNATINKYQVLNGKVFMKQNAFLENSIPINITTPPTAYTPVSASYPTGYTARLFFDRYDTSGNISQVHKSNDANMSYIWDYYGNYPVAEATNSDSTSIAFTSFESNGSGNWVVPSGSEITSQSTVTVNSAAASTTIFTTQIPVAATNNDNLSTVGQEVGVKFTSNTAGIINGIRFYKTAGNSGTHIGELYATNGMRLAQATFTNETATGWQTVTFSKPVAIKANTTYIAAYFSSLGYYTEDNNYFLNHSVTNGALTAPADSTGGAGGSDPGNGQGLFRYNSTPVFPNQIFASANYWVDVLFSTGIASPVSNAGINLTISSPTSSVTLDGSGSAGTITSYQWTLISGPNNPTITTPTSITTTVTGLIAGSYNFQLSLNGGLSISTVTITVNAANTTNIFTTQVPVATTNNDNLTTVGDEMGVKFKSSVAGKVTGIRFYKTAGNTGTHIGELYSSTGTRLAQATFSGETATGWQTVTFSAPVSITANTTYIAAYFSSLGYYTEDNGFFLNHSQVNSPLTAQSDGTNGGFGTDPGTGQGLYKNSATAVFPNQIYQSANYWVDVVFTNTTASPVANSGTYAAITLPNSTITLNGSGSTGTITSYAWTKVSGPNTPTITTPSAVTTTVTGLIAGTYVFKLSVNGTASTSQSTIIVNAAPAPNPNAGSNQTITLPASSVTLDGSGSSGSITNYLWTMISGPNNPVITNPNSIVTTVTGLTQGTYTFQLSGNGGSSSSFGLTGLRSYNMGGNSIVKTGLTSGNKYVLSYWTRGGACTITGGTNVSSTGRSTNGWTYYEHVVTMTSTTLSVTGSNYIDELRLYPVGSQMKTYAYQPLVGSTSANDANSEITFYEYDGLQRLKNIKDYQGNIINNYQYNYAPACTSCTVAMQTFANTPTLSYPVGVFSATNKLLGNATSQAQYISLWNADAGDHAIGTLAVGSDSMHFVLTVNSGQTSPGVVIGCRYYQFDIAYTQIDAVLNRNGCYVDFGDGFGMFLGKSILDTSVVVAPFTVNANWGYIPYWVHKYFDSTQRTITFYHNDDGNASESVDDYAIPATSLLHLKNLRGILPQSTTVLQSDCFQQATANSVSAITNWNSINSITAWVAVTGDYTNPCTHMNFTQDFMANNKNLQVINTSRGLYLDGYTDTTFKLTRLKTNWNTYFTSLNTIIISDDHWNREDLTGLNSLRNFQIYAGSLHHSLSQTNNPLVPIPVATIDNIINQIRNGAGQAVSNGYVNISSGGNLRSSASDASVAFLKSKGWTINIIGIPQ